MMERTWMISLDIGGTAATGVVVLWPDGPVFGLSCPSKNLRAMSVEELATLINNISTKIDEAGDIEKALWLIGAAGARPEADRQRWAQAMAELGLKATDIVVSRDYEANHAAAFGGEDGILSVNGTGSVLFGRKDGTDLRRGGWGFLLDTSPSGAEFGRLVMQQVLGAIEDNAHENGIFCGFQKQFRHLEIDRAALLDWLYADPAAQRRLGEIAPVLTVAADEGDRTAEALVSASLRRWASDVWALSGELGFGNRVPLAGIGGLWSRWKAFPERALAVLNERKPGRCTLKQPAFPPSWGPLIRYLAGSPRGLDLDAQRHLRSLADKVH